MNDGWNAFMWNGAEWNGLAVAYTMLNAQFSLCFMAAAVWEQEISGTVTEC
jgi:hypothetical protein